MKKYLRTAKNSLLLMLVLALLFTLAACGGKTEKTPATDKEDDGTRQEQSDGDDGDDSGAAADDTPGDSDSVSGFTPPDGWEEGGYYYDYIDNVWDSSVLPAWFPEQTEGVKPAETSYKAAGKDTLNMSTNVGWINFEDMDFERYSVSFYATEAQLQDFLTQVEAAGMIGGFIDDFPYNIYNYVGHDWVLEIYFNTDDDTPEDGEGDWDGCVTAIMAPVSFGHPETFRGEPLPQCGVTTVDYFENYWYFDDNYDEVVYDLRADNETVEGEYWSAWFNYCGCSDDDLRAYAQLLTDHGWTQQYDGTDGDNNYYVCMEKDGVTMLANIRNWQLEVGFSPLPENLSY